MIKSLMSRPALRVALAALSLSMLPALAPAQTTDVAKPVKLLTAGEQGLALQRSFFGQVKARRTVDLAFQVDGQIKQFPVIKGVAISKGDLIAELDLETFELNRNQAKLQKEQAERRLERLSQLRGTAASQVAVEDAETDVGLTAIALRNAEWALEHATLSAPFDGLIAMRNTELFSTVEAGQPVVRIHDMSELRIDVDVPEILFQQASTESDFDIEAKFPAFEQRLPLQLREFDADTSSVGQTYRLTFGVTAPEGRTILPGSSVTVIVRARNADPAILLPATAIVANTAGETGVMVFNPDGGTAGAATGTVTWTKVEIQPTQTGEVHVVGGIDAGTELVRTGGGALTDGQPLRRFTGFSN